MLQGRGSSHGRVCWWLLLLPLFPTFHTALTSRHHSADTAHHMHQPAYSVPALPTHSPVPTATALVLSAAVSGDSVEWGVVGWCHSLLSLWLHNASSTRSVGSACTLVLPIWPTSHHITGHEWLMTPPHLSSHIGQQSPHAGSMVVRIDLLQFLAGCRKMRLNQDLSVLSLSLGFFWCMCCAVN